MNESSEFWRREVLKDDYRARLGKASKGMMGGLKKALGYTIAGVVSFSAFGLLGMLGYAIATSETEEEMAKRKIQEKAYECSIIKIKNRLLEKSLEIATGGKKLENSLEEQEIFAKRMGWYDQNTMGKYKLFKFGFLSREDGESFLKIEGLKKYKEEKPIAVEVDIPEEIALKNMRNYLIKDTNKKLQEKNEKI